MASGWLGYSPLEAWKLSPREITAAFKGWESRTKYLVTIQRNIALGAAVLGLSPYSKQGSQSRVDDLMRLPWEEKSGLTKKDTEEMKDMFPSQLPNWANGSK